MTLALASPKALLAALAGLAALLALKSGKAASPEPQPIPGSVPSPTDMPIAQRMAIVLATRDPAAIRFEAGRLRLEGYPSQALELETAAAKLEAEQAAVRPPSPPVVITSPGLPQLPSIPLPSIPLPPIVTGLPGGGVLPPPSIPLPGVLSPVLLPVALPAGVVLKNGKPLYLPPGGGGPLVTAWQLKLISLGFPVGAGGADGRFGDGTTAATKAFQTAANVAFKAAGKPLLAVDGIVGNATLAAATGASLVPAPASSTPPAPVAVPPAVSVPANQPLPASPPAGALNLNGVVLKVGSSGALVKAWQLKLISLGFSVGKAGADGDFGADTEKATKAFQTASNAAAGAGQKIAVDGKVGPDTVARAFAATPVTTATPVKPPTASSAPAPAPIPAAAPVLPPAPPFVLPAGTILQSGSSGTTVKAWQVKLISLGFSVGAKGADGSFGPDTVTATKAFQTASNNALKAGATKLTVDGKVGPATVARVNVARVGPAPAVAPGQPLAATPLFGAIPPMAPVEPDPRRALAARLLNSLSLSEEQGAPLGSEDTSLVRLFQMTEGQRPSGYYGPGTAIVLAGRYGIVPPKPLYWPATGTARAKASYRRQLSDIAARDPQRVEEWQRAASV